jgi:radical SAM protein with 4Fe4S-binding SPASM domain
MLEILQNIKLRPKNCVWELTARCNLHCRHCASGLGAGRTRGEELTQEERLRVCRELKDLGCEHVTLSGGEALLDKGWAALAERSHALGMYVSLITNGMAVTDRTAAEIRSAGISLVGLSLDGLETTHNYIRRHPRSFAAVCAAFARLTSQGILVNIVTHVNQMNLHELPAMEDFVASLPANLWRIQLGSPLGSLAEHPELQLFPEDVPSIADFIVEAKRRNRVNVSVGDSVGYFSRHESELRATPERGPFDFWCGCSAGCLTVGIEANGNVKGCLSLQSERFVEGNLRTESLKTIWERPGGFAYTRHFKPADLHGACSGCEMGEICRGGCTFMSLGATGSPHNNPYCISGVERRAASRLGKES